MSTKDGFCSWLFQTRSEKYEDTTGVVGVVGRVTKNPRSSLDRSHGVSWCGERRCFGTVHIPDLHRQGGLSVQLWDRELPYHKPLPRKPSINPNLIQFSGPRSTTLITGHSSLWFPKREREREGTLLYLYSIDRCSVLLSWEWSWANTTRGLEGRRSWQSFI